MASDSERRNDFLRLLETPEITFRGAVSIKPNISRGYRVSPRAEGHLSAGND